MLAALKTVSRPRRDKASRSSKWRAERSQNASVSFMPGITSAMNGFEFKFALSARRERNYVSKSIINRKRCTNRRYRKSLSLFSVLFFARTLTRIRNRRGWRRKIGSHSIHPLQSCASAAMRVWKAIKMLEKRWVSTAVRRVKARMCAE